MSSGDKLQMGDKLWSNKNGGGGELVNFLPDGGIPVPLPVGKKKTLVILM